MKKRLLSLAMAIAMVLSLMPVNAIADSVFGDTVITKQPVSVTVQAGENAVFTISATNLGASSPLKYLWYDAQKVTRVNKIGSLDTFLAQFDGAKLGEGTKLTVYNAQENMEICCVVYYEGSLILRGIAQSNIVNLTVVPACKSHVLGENLFEVSATEATCAHEGNKTYYKCNVCGRCYADKTAIVSTTEDACTIAKLSTHQMPLIHHDAVPGTCGERSTAEYWECAECGQLFEDEAGTKTTTLTALRLNGQKDPDNHPADKVTHKEYTEPTCSAKGNFEYWYCDECNTYFKNAELTEEYAKRSDTEIAKDASKHAELVEHPYTAATCEADGNLPYFECTDCHNRYANADGTNQYANKNDVLIKANGHDYKWIEFTQGDTVYHAKECTKCGTRTETGTHTGGAASCKDKAICSTCGLPYGETDPNNHVNREVRDAVEATITKPGYSGDIFCADCGVLIEKGHQTDKLCKHTDPESGVVVHHDAIEATCPDSPDKHEGSIEYWECSECGKCWSDSELSAEITKADTVIAYQQHYKQTVFGGTVANSAIQKQNYDENSHWYECKFCGVKYADTVKAHNMVEKTHTCCSGDTCSSCGYDNKQYDPYNHSGGTEIRGAYEPTLLKAGYTGDTYCLGCGDVIAYGHEYYKPCTDGCKDLKQIPGKAKTCTTDGTKTYYECNKCHNYYMDAKATVPATDESLIDPCTGHDLHPTLNLLGDISVKQLLDLLKSPDYADIIKSVVNGSITIDDALKNVHIRDIDHCHDDEYHWLGCQRCGKTLADLKPEFEEKGIYIKDIWYTIGEKEAHAGGTATCKVKAKCTECGEYYGDFADHRYGENNTCTVCGDKIQACEAPKLSASSNGKVVLKWNAVDGAASYEIYRATDGVNFVRINTVSGTSYTDGSASVGTRYYYKVRARGTNGSFGAFSEMKAVDPKCAAPVVTAGNNASTGKITLKWQAVNGAVKYEIWRAGTANGSYSKMYTTSSTSYTNTSSYAGYTYYYKVRAISADGKTSEFSKIASRTCDCAAPAVKSGNDASTGYVKLSWDKVYGASKYEIWRADSKNGTYTRIYTTTYTTYTNTSSKAGYTYYYKVKAISERTSYANSALSSVVARTCDCARPTVTISLNNGDPRLTWNSVSGADKYVVYRATSKNGTYTKMYTTSYKSYTNTSAKAGTTYYYKVVAVSNISSSANSAYSNIVSIKAK